MKFIKKNLLNILLAIILLTGIGLISYPTVSNWINDMNQSRAVLAYVESSDDLSEQKKKDLIDGAKEYNKRLFEKSDRYFFDKDELERYNNTLDITGTGIMAYVEIPSIDVILPIYHGTDEGILQIAIGHIQGTSLPVGGTNTHTVISGHRGLPSARLFTDLDRLKKGDIFFIRTLDQNHAYEVDEISVVDPTEVEKIEIEPGRDMCTLVTCTPYGVNSHRLLVRGSRTNYVGKTNDTKKEVEKKIFVPIIVLSSLVFIVVVSLIIIIKRKSLKNR